MRFSYHFHHSTLFFIKNSIFTAVFLACLTIVPFHQARGASDQDSDSDSSICPAPENECPPKRINAGFFDTDPWAPSGSFRSERFVDSYPGSVRHDEELRIYEGDTEFDCREHWWNMPDHIHEKYKDYTTRFHTMYDWAQGCSIYLCYTDDNKPCCYRCCKRKGGAAWGCGCPILAGWAQPPRRFSCWNSTAGVIRDSSGNIVPMEKNYDYFLRNLDALGVKGLRADGTTFDISDECLSPLSSSSSSNPAYESESSSSIWGNVSSHAPDEKRKCIVTCGSHQYEYRTELTLAECTAFRDQMAKLPENQEAQCGYTWTK
jgi:hypothetical protein